MENASKALLIAGAILICILLIGVGMLVYSSAQGTVDEALSSMSEQEINMYNSKFTTYEGPRQSGSNVKTLLGRIRTNNTTNGDITEKKVTVVLNGTDITSDISTNMSKIVTAGTYNVVVSDENSDGLMDKVTITYNSTTKS